MVSLLLAVILGSVTSETVPHKDYAEAYRVSVAEHKPLMVVVGAPWCPACNVLKENTLEPMAATGELSEVSVAMIDRDVDPELAQQLTKGDKMLPQIIVFSRGNDGSWQRRRLTGFQPKQPVRSLIRSAISMTQG